MKATTRLLLLLFLPILVWSCRDDDGNDFQDVNIGDLSNLTGADGELGRAIYTIGDPDMFMIPESYDLENIPQDPNNPLNAEKVALGKKLFYETGLGVDPANPDGMEKYSCASCHVPGSAFQAGIRQGIGEGGIGFGVEGEGRTPNPGYLVEDLDIQPIRTPSAMNGAFNRTTLWNGQFGAVGPNVGTESSWAEGTPIENNHLGFHGLETQAIAGFSVHRMGVNEDLIMDTYYQELFKMAFPEYPESERYSKITIGLAIAAYERTLLTSQAPFQQWLKGDLNAMTDRQKVGGALFFGKAGCVSCHNSPVLGAEEFHAIGMPDLEGADILPVPDTDMDKVFRGRGGFTGNSDDDYKFKTPQLYSLKSMKFLGHGASYSTIREVIEYKVAGVPANSRVPLTKIADGFKPLELDEDQIRSLTDFVENALNDTNLERFVPSSTASGNCFPNNDTVSQLDLGCD